VPSPRIIKRTPKPEIRWEKLHYYPRGKIDVRSCDVYKGTDPNGAVRYRIVVLSSHPGSFAWPVDVALTEKRHQMFGSLRAIEFGVATKDAPRDIEWRSLGQFPDFNSSHIQDGVWGKPDYCIMTKDWVPVPRTLPKVRT
jgi:hypothetical protein